MEHACNKCNKTYASYQSLWIHNKKFHNPDSMKKYPDSDHKVAKTNRIYICKYCKKEYDNKSSKYKHQKKCADKKDEIQKLKIEFDSKIEQLEKKVNKKVVNTNHGTIYNGNVINNNITINKIGSENLLDFNDHEISQIFNKELEGVITFIELLNFNERLPQNHNYCTTSLESKYLSTYNDETKTIEKDRKKYFFDKLLNSSIDRIQILYNSNKNKFTKTKQKQIEENITNLKTFKNYDFNNKILKEMINKMNLVSYNKKKIVQKTWHEDSDSDDDFQRDLEKETKAEFYKKLEMKEKLLLEQKQVSDSSSSIKKLEIKPKVKSKIPVIKKPISESEESDSYDITTSNVFLETYKN